MSLGAALVPLGYAPVGWRNSCVFGGDGGGGVRRGGWEDCLVGLAFVCPLPIFPVQDQMTLKTRVACAQRMGQDQSHDR